MRKISKKWIILYIFLIISLFLSNFISLFYYLVPFILAYPLFFEDFKALGFKNYKKGIIVGLLSSLFYIPFINLDTLDIRDIFNMSFVVFLEEVFFRGYLFKEIVFPKDSHLKNILISVLFSISHVVLYLDITKLSVFFPSIIFGYLFIYTGSIAAPFIFHIFSNLFFISFFSKYFYKVINSIMS